MRIQRPCIVAMLTALAVLAQSQGSDILKERLLAPADPIAYQGTVQEAIQLYTAQKFSEAVAKFEQAVTDYPLDGRIWIYYGHALRASGKLKEAIPAYHKGIELKSTWQGITTYYWLARTYLEAGDKEGAYKALETLVFQEPYVRRPDLYEDQAFASLKSEPRFMKIAGKVDTSKMSRTEGWRTDIDYVIAEIKRVNHKFKDRPLPKEVTDRQNRLKRDVPKLTDDEIYVRMGHMLAPLNQGHVSLALLPATKLTPLRTLPLQFYAFPEGIFIVASDPKNHDLVGTEVLRIEQTPPAEVLKRIEQHTSVENPMKIIWGGMRGLGSIQILRGLGVLAKDKEEVRLTLRSQDGKTFERVLGSVGTEQNRKLVPPLGMTPPLFLKNVPRQHWFEKMADADALFIQVNQVSAAPDETMQAFGLRLRTYLNENAVKNLILDVRHNNGGNTATYTELLRTLVGHSIKEGNRLFVIIGRGVYSATGNLITDLERLASPVFVGEPSSGFGNQDGDESFTILPYSGIRGWLTSVWWQYSHPWDMRRSITPHVPVQLTAKDYFAGKDPVLEVILAMMKRG